MKTESPARFVVTAIVTFWENEKRHPLGSTNDIGTAHEIAAQDGARYYPLHSTCSMFDLEILDTVTGQKIAALAAEHKARAIARAMPTVADVGYW